MNRVRRTIREWNRLTRRGTLIWEMVIVLGLLGSLIALVLPLCIIAARRQQEIARSQVAVLEMSNALERITARKYAELTSDKLVKEVASDWSRDLCPGAELKLMVQDVAGPPAGKQLTAEFTWNQRRTQHAPPIRLTTWVFPQEKESP